MKGGSRTIQKDIFFLICGATLAALLLVGSLFQIYFYITLGKSLERYSDSTSRAIESALRSPLYTLSDDIVVNIAQAYLSTGKIEGIRVISEATGVIVDEPPRRETDASAIEILISESGMDVGKAFLWFSDVELRSSLRNLALMTAGFLLGVMVALTLSLFIVFRCYLVKPFSPILTGIQAIGEGEYGHRIQRGRHEDLNLLIDTVNSMAENILGANHRLLESERRYGAVFDTSFVAVFIHDANGKILDVNRAMLQMFGLNDKTEALSYDIEKDYSAKENDIPPLKRTWADVITGAERNFSWFARRPHDGSIFPTEVNLRRVDLTDGPYILANVIDLSERRKIEEQLIQAQKMEAVGLMAGGLAHDFNNILAGITGSVSLLQLKAERGEILEEDELAQHLETINDAAFRAANVVKKLLSLSKKQEFHTKLMDFRDVLSHVLAIVSSSMDRSIEIVTSNPSDPLMIMGDPTQLEQVVLNIIVNSAHAMTLMRPSGQAWGGKLLVTWGACVPDDAFRRIHPQAQQKAYHLLCIRDSGVGMSADTLAKIFTPFFTTKETGTGLGLSMVYGIIKSHEGFLTVYSEPGLGTSFNIYLPQADGSQAGLEERQMSLAAFKGSGRVLVIDDEELFRSNLAAILEEIGFTVMQADDGEEGLSSFRDNAKSISFVMLDMVMAKKSGRECFTGIKANYPDIPIILMSGFRQDPRIEETLEEGVSAFLQKPFDTKSLLDALRRVNPSGS